MFNLNNRFVFHRAQTVDTIDIRAFTIVIMLAEVTKLNLLCMYFSLFRIQTILSGQVVSKLHFSPAAE